MTGRPRGVQAETIATYDAIAHQYAVRFAVTDRPSRRREFCSLLGDDTAMVLDAGCGPGLGSRRLAAAGVQVIGLDLSAGMLAEARTITGAPLVRGDVAQLPLPAGCLGGVWCDAALVHLDAGAVNVVLHELARVVASGGPLFLSFCLGDGAEWQVGPGGRRRWFHYHDGDRLLAALDGAGFAAGATSSELDGGGTWVSTIARRRSPR